LGAVKAAGRNFVSAHVANELIRAGEQKTDFPGEGKGDAPSSHKPDTFLRCDRISHRAVQMWNEAYWSIASQ